MHDDELYELARQRVNQRNRRMIGLGVNVFAMFVYLGIFSAFGSVIPRGIGALIAITWIGAVAFHAMLLSITQNRADSIDREVERLRQQVYDEKPKRESESRLELTDDGELVAFDDLPPRDAKQKDSL